ncbi:hypothetical protein [Beijerinckia indica]|uniref:Glycosyltransferase RgtA/B/C/D-like domain-containing protein n=1 Tax=Beijerinckia indica subsp. indica (strain ATCC 9039 / DSM 1715 / NCIMB 8712) TaxID=395963 RepID=B2IJ04_BEII9|nr:hypothetical protein [Beijerinckia indica]ACB94767.1 hypothetical protein Bind_1125 [Beijerinckia indica subsp. indica ATCC 9039]
MNWNKETRVSEAFTGFSFHTLKAKPFIALLCILFPAFFSFVMLLRFHTPEDQFLSYFTDDFFYYLKIAMNIADHHRSSFDMLHDTNGYHPLWLALITLQYYLFGNTTALFISIVIMISIINTLSFFIFLTIALKLTNHLVAAVASSIYSATLMFTLSRTGMEVSLGILALALLALRLLQTPLEVQTRKQAIVTGLLISFAFLSRIDAILMPFLYICAGIVYPIKSRARLAMNTIYAGIGCIPIFFYLAFNHFYFSSALPISGAAKQLKTGFFPSSSTLLGLFGFSGYNIIFIWPIALSALLYVVLSLSGRVRCPSGDRLVVTAVLLHPLVFYPLLAFRSDWALWAWYFYPIVMVGIVVLPALLQLLLERLNSILINRLVLIGSIAVAIVTLQSIIPINPIAFQIYEAAKELKEFSATHHGTFAMGDRAGTAGYLLDDPIVQLEGLVGDKQMLQNIRAERNLNDVLKELNVRYYVATGGAFEGDCYTAHEPGQAGPKSPHMTGQFCQAPIHEFHVGPAETRIFEIGKQ